MGEDGGNCRFLYFAVLSVNLASFTAGTALAWSSPSLPKLNGNSFGNPLEEPITPSEESMIASLIAIGGIFGPLIAGYLQDKLGRKKTTIIAVVPIYISFIIIAIANQVWHFYLARLLSGISTGAAFVVLPNYVAEVSEKHNRGALSCLLVFNVTLGNLVIYCIGPYLSISLAAILCLIAPTLFFFIVTIYIPESPYHLIKYDEEAAAVVLAKLRGKETNQIKAELLEIKTSVEESFANEVGIIDLFKNKILLKGLLITCGLITFQQFSGVDAILFYLESIFDAAGSDLSPAVSSIIIALTQAISALIAPLIVDRLGRRFLLFLSGAGNALSLISVGIFFYIKEDVDSIAWLPIVSLVVFMVTYSAGYGPIPFTVLGEIFPCNFKAVASMLTVSVCFVCTFAATSVFPYMLIAIGSAASFWVFAAFCVASLFFVYFLLPETKGKSLAEIQKMMNKQL